MIRAAALCLVLASPAAAQTQSFEGAFGDAAARYCDAVDRLERDLVVTRPGPERMRDNLREVVQTGRTVTGFMENFSFEGTGAGQAEWLMQSLAGALACRDRAARAGADWWAYYRNSGFFRASDARREADFAEGLAAMEAAARQRLAERP